MHIFSLPTSPAELARNTRWLSLLLWGLLLVLSMVVWWLGRTPTGELQPVIWQVGVALGLVSVASGLAWTQHDRLAAGLLIGGTAFIGLLGALLQRELGTASALVVVVGMNSLALVLLPMRQAERVLLPSFGVGAVAVLLDMFGPPDRPALSSPGARYVVLGLVLGLYLIALVRNFRALPWRNKLLFSATALVASMTILIAQTTLQVTQAELLATIGKRQKDLAASQAQTVGVYLTAQVQTLRHGLALNKYVQDALSAQNAAYPVSVSEHLAAQETAWQGGALTAPLVMDRQQNDLASELVELRHQAPGYLALWVTDRYGGLQAALPPPAHYDQTPTPWWTTAVQGQVYIGPPTHFTAWQRDGLEIAVPIVAHNGTSVEGVLYAVIDLHVLAQQLLNDTTPGSVHTDNLFFPPDQEISFAETLGPMDENPHALAQLLAEPLSNYVIGQDRRLYSLHPVPFTQLTDVSPAHTPQWYVVASDDLTVALTPVETATRTITLAALGVLTTSTLLTLGFARLLLRPLRTLTHAAQQVQAGQWQTLVPITSLDEMGVLAQAFNAMTQQLRQLIKEAEQLALDRAQALNHVATISARLADITDEAHLAAETVAQIQAAFGYECVLVLWATGEELRVAAGTPPVGPQLLAEDYRQPFGTGAIGQAAARNQPVLVADTTTHPDWQPHPLRPTTQAEIAVPIARGAQVLGVLDVQQSARALTPADVVVLKTIANLVAVSLQNARQLTQARALAEREAQARALTQAIQNATTVEAALQVATRELGRLTGRATYVKLHGSEEEPLG